jgi:ubiquinone/menaquinone biosynthesis C-methylase UbiE
MAKIFVSYHRASKDAVEALVQYLRADGHDVWFDQNLTGGQNWWNDILSKIRECEVFVAAFTQESLESRPCKCETRYAYDLKRRLLPVQLSNTVSLDSLPPYLGELQCVDYSRRDVSTFQKLQRALKLLLPAPPLPDPLPNPPAISLLNWMRDRIESESPLERLVQSGLVSELERQFRNGESPKEITYLLQLLKKRSDLLADVMQDIDELMRDVGRGPPANRLQPSEPEQPGPDEDEPRQPRVVAAAHEADIPEAHGANEPSMLSPAVPVSDLSHLKERIETDSQLQLQDQIELVFDLRQQVRKGESPNEIIDLLQRLRRRDDILAKVMSDIDDLMRVIGSGLPEAVQRRTLDETTLDLRHSYAKEVIKEHELPGANAPRFSALSPTLTEDLLVRPSAYPMTPMYLLDNAFRIIDWNEAFTVAFDRTMEGRKGRGVLEWTYFLDNYDEVLDHGVKAFGDTNELPTIDVETIQYTSQRYGKLTAKKRAYQIPDDNHACLAWLVTLDVKFADTKQHATYQRDLIRVLGLDLMWTEYAVGYDRVLTNSRVYPELLDKFIGGYDGVRMIPDGAKILDLGAGTGNFAERLITKGPGRVIVAVENNRLMLELLRGKCQKYLRTDPSEGGIFPIKQDITSLFGLEDNEFDFVTLNNVLYAVQDAESCLKECCRVLKPGGELRLSGPRQDTNLKLLFDRIGADLKETGKFEELQADYYQAYQINELKLRPMLYRWTTKEIEEMLLKAGFKAIIHSSEDVYAGQSMFVCAVK